MREKVGLGFIKGKGVEGVWRRVGGWFIYSILLSRLFIVIPMIDKS